MIFSRNYCFLQNVQDSSQPDINCFVDARWSPSKGRFFSTDACRLDDSRPTIETGPVLTHQTNPTTVSQPNDPTTVSRPKVPTTASRPNVLTTASRPNVPTTASQPKVPTIANRPKVPTTVGRPKVTTTVSQSNGLATTPGTLPVNVNRPNQSSKNVEISSPKSNSGKNNAKTSSPKTASAKNEEDNLSLEFLTLFRNSLNEKESSEVDLPDYDYDNFYNDRSRKKKDSETVPRIRGELSEDSMDRNGKDKNIWKWLTNNLG